MHVGFKASSAVPNSYVRVRHMPEELSAAFKQLNIELLFSRRRSILRTRALRLTPEASRMSNAYVTSVPFRTLPDDINVLYDDKRTQMLPKLRVHQRVMREISVSNLAVSATGVLGYLIGRHLEASPPRVPSTILIDSLALFESCAFNCSAGDVFIPLVKCQDTNISATLSTGRSERKRIDRKGLRSANNTSVFNKFGAVALFSVIADDVTVVLTVDIPAFCLWKHNLSEHDSSAPLLSEVSLTIALNAGTPIREGEHVGFLCRTEGDRDSRIVEPTHMDRDVARREIVGMWALGAEDMVWLASAIYLSEVTSKRNRKICPIRRSRVGEDRRSTDEREQSMDYVLALFSPHGGAPRLFDCRIQHNLDDKNETFLASVFYSPSSTTSHPSPNETCCADFVPISALARTVSNCLQNSRSPLDSTTSPGIGATRKSSIGVMSPVQSSPHLQDISDHVDALRQSLNLEQTPAAKSASFDPNLTTLGTSAAGSSSYRRKQRVSWGPNDHTDVARFERQAQKKDSSGDWDGIARSETDSVSNMADYSKCPSTTALQSQDRENSNDEESWERMDELARKYLGEDYTMNFGLK